MEAVMEQLGALGAFLWGPWTPWALLAAGVLATVFTRFTQITAMTHGVAVVRGVYDDPNDPGAINHFQALSAALSATVGLGNIGGVALAISAGGPGALVWMWIVGFFGMALKTVEITLAMMYRNTDDPENPSGGAMWVVDKVVGGKGGIWVPIVVHAATDLIHGDVARMLRQQLAGVSKEVDADRSGGPLPEKA